MDLVLKQKTPGIYGLQDTISCTGLMAANLTAAPGRLRAATKLQTEFGGFQNNVEASSRQKCEPVYIATSGLP